MNHHDFRFQQRKTSSWQEKIYMSRALELNYSDISEDIINLALILTNATSRSKSKRQVCVRQDFFNVLGCETLRVKLLRIWKIARISLNPTGRNSNTITAFNRYRNFVRMYRINGEILSANSIDG